MSGIGMGEGRGGPELSLVLPGAFTCWIQQLLWTDSGFQGNRPQGPFWPGCGAAPSHRGLGVVPLTLP